MPRGTMGLGRSVAYDGKLYCFGGEYTNGGDQFVLLRFISRKSTGAFFQTAELSGGEQIRFAV